MRNLSVFAAFLVLCACSDPKKPAPTPPVTPEGKTPTKVTEAPKAQTKPTPPKIAQPPKKIRPKSVKSRSVEGKKIAREFKKLIRQGRKFVRKQEYPMGVRMFEAALKLDPNHARALSELGWAAYKNNDLDKAERANLDSVRFAKDNVSIKGASLYNLGRIEEERNNGEAAASFYKRSLAIRSNKVVAKRLKGLEDRGVVARVSLEGSCALQQGAKATLPKALTAWAKKHDFIVNDPRSGGVLAQFEVKGTKLTSAAVFGLYRDDESTNYLHLGLQYDGAWHFTELFLEYNPGAFGIFEEFKLLEMETRQLVPGGEPEIFVRFSHERSDTDMGIDEFESETRKVVHIFGVVENKPAALFHVVESQVYERDRLGHIPNDEIDKNFATKGLPIRKRSGLALQFDSIKGEAVLTQKKGVTPSYKPGTYAIATFPQRCSN